MAGALAALPAAVADKVEQLARQHGVNLTPLYRQYGADAVAIAVCALLLLALLALLLLLCCLCRGRSSNTSQQPQRTPDSQQLLPTYVARSDGAEAIRPRPEGAEKTVSIQVDEGGRGGGWGDLGSMENMERTEHVSADGFESLVSLPRPVLSMLRDMPSHPNPNPANDTSGSAAR